MVPGRKFSTTTSAWATRSRNSALPRSCLRSRPTLCLLRLMAMKSAPSPSTKTTPTRRLSSPSPGRSILTTSAPRSAKSIVAYGPARYCVRSSTRAPASGPGSGRRLMRPSQSILRARAASAAMTQPEDRFQYISYEQDGRLVVVTIRRPEVRNALHLAADRELDRAWRRFEEDESAWVAILTGDGDRAFCAG